MKRGGVRYGQYTVLLRMLTYDLRSVSGMRSIAEGGSGKSRAGVSIAKPNAKNTIALATNSSAGFGDFDDSTPKKE
ncbi:MAG: hypothetical protein C5617_004395 [ANME-2 cluster archaeon]|jgi:hypothetical protein|nr:MAG: hypothetical protein C5617_004395 [ANME-2 cluster archaeon]